VIKLGPGTGGEVSVTANAAEGGVGGGPTILRMLLGAHLRRYDSASGSVTGTSFAVWAPNARAVSVIGDFNGWNAEVHPLAPRPDQSGVWTGFIAGVSSSAFYKYRITTDSGGSIEKADPFALSAELPPATASRAWALDYEWGDGEWMTTRGARNALDAPMAVYEVHAGSWRRKDNTFLGYRELAHALADYIEKTGFTHVELMPLTEHPFYGSWGYQTTGYFAPTARYGTPQDFMYLVDHLHQRGIGVILDWVPSHFPDDAHGLARFDGTHLYEHADPKQGYHPEWNSSIFNYGRHEVRAFLLSSALFWLEKYHVDGLRVDAVASMLYLDYARKEGEWIPNRHGGKENLEAIQFLRALNEAVYRDHPDAFTVAEESTAWPMVSRPVTWGGLGFGYKWNMGWMHDTLDYIGKDPIHRKHHHGQILFGLHYAFSENFILPLSHDEVVHGKRSIFGRMPGDPWQRFANLRAYYAFMYGHPGKKLLFMGNEIAQEQEWSHERSLDWHLLERARNAGIQALVRDLNRLYRSLPALHELDCEDAGFEWVVSNDADHSVFAWMRQGKEPRSRCLVVVNFTPQVHTDYRIKVPFVGTWREVLNTDAAVYGGSGVGNGGSVNTLNKGPIPEVSLVIPPLAAIFLVPEV